MRNEGERRNKRHLYYNACHAHRIRKPRRWMSNRQIRIAPWKEPETSNNRQSNPSIRRMSLTRCSFVWKYVFYHDHTQYSTKLNLLCCSKNLNKTCIHFSSFSLQSFQFLHHNWWTPIMVYRFQSLVPHSEHICHFKSKLPFSSTRSSSNVECEF